MPCSDVTELIQVTLDSDERLADYFFSKRTCGQGVGAGNLLINLFRGRSVDEILAMDADRFVSEHPVEDELEEFLGLKHFFAIQSVLEVLTGKEPGGKGDPCAAAEIAYEDGCMVIEGQIAVDLVTDKIKACGNCSKCGKSKKAKVVFN
ncbi:MAG: hypothetical protein IT365_09985 [Candidatus Hydrogenedentes bacterium]|nr:hypothetical protein [Candidatus Hydrogenedentota bacterium]